MVLDDRRTTDTMLIVRATKGRDNCNLNSTQSWQCLRYCHCAWDFRFSHLARMIGTNGPDFLGKLFLTFLVSNMLDRNYIISNDGSCRMKSFIKYRSASNIEMKVSTWCNAVTLLRITHFVWNRCYNVTFSNKARKTYFNFYECTFEYSENNSCVFSTPSFSNWVNFFRRNGKNTQK